MYLDAEFGTQTNIRYPTQPYREVTARIKYILSKILGEISFKIDGHGEKIKIASVLMSYCFFRKIYSTWNSLPFTQK